MSSCDESNIKKNYIVQSAADFDVLSACTAFYTNNIYNCTGGTLTLHSSIVSANTINASVYLSGGTNILDILVSLDNFTTGATLVGSEVVFDRTDSLSAYTLDLSSLDVNDTFVTGFTYDNANTFTISDNSGTTFNATFNTVTGLTVNGGLSATTVSACTGIYTSNLYGCSPITIHDSVQSITSSATGTTSFAFGEDNNAHGHFSFAINRLNTSSGLASFASGRRSIASGSYSHSIGVDTKATATASYAEGSNTVASGSSAHAEGESTIAGSGHAHAEGNLTIAIGESSHSEGEGTTASGIASHAEGYYNLAIGNASHAEGGHDGSPMSNPTSATTHSAHAEGMGTLASGIASHAEGNLTTASGSYSHAGGSNSIASGITSFIHSTSSLVTGDRSVVLGGQNITGTTNDTVYVPNLNIGTAPIDNSLSQIIARGSDGTIKYRDVDSIISAATSADTYVTGFTYDNINTFTISDNSGSTFNASINVLSATTISATTFYGDGSNLTGIPHTTDTFVSGGTYNDPTKEIKFSGNSAQTTFEVDLTSLVSSISGDTFISSFDYSPNTLTITRNDGTGFTANISEFSAITVTGLTVNSDAQFNDNVTVDGNTLIKGNVTILGTATTIDSETVLIKDNILTLNSNATGTTAPFPVDSGLEILRNSATTSTLLWEESNQYWAAGLSGSTSKIILEGDSLSLLVSGHTHPIGEIIGLQSALDTKVSGATNLSSTGIFAQKTGQNLEFKGITSTGGTVDITNDSTTVNLEVTIPPDDNTFVTGFTYDNINAFTITDNLGTAFTASINVLSATTISGGTLFGDGSNLTGIPHTTDTFVTGGTYNPGTVNLDFSGNPGFLSFAVDVSALKDDTNTYVTGNTYTAATDNTNQSSLHLLYQGTPVGGPYSLSSEDTFVTGTTFASNQAILTRNDGTEIFKLSGSSSVQLTNPSGNKIDIDVTIPPGMNTYVTGFTYDDINTFTINDNLGSAFTASINVLSATTISGGTLYGDGSNLTGISTENTTITAFTYDNANTFTITDSSGSTFDASINIMTGLTINGDLNVNGESVFSGTSTDVVQIYGSGTTSPIFRIQGSSGELFSVTDSLVGELFAVNDISGIPILQVHSDNRIILGDNLAPSLYTTAKVTASSGSSTSIYSVPVSAYTGAWFEYTANDGTSLRAGNITSIFTASDVNHNETTTTDIGNTSDLIMDVSVSGGNATLTASATTSNWEIKTIIRSI